MDQPLATWQKDLKILALPNSTLQRLLSLCWCLACQAVKRKMRSLCAGLEGLLGLGCVALADAYEIEVAMIAATRMEGKIPAWHLMRPCKSVLCSAARDVARATSSSAHAAQVL